MKMNFKNIATIMGLISITAVACDKKTDWLAERTYEGFNSYVKIVHASPNFRVVHGNNRDSFNVFVGAAKANGTFLTYGSVMPASSANYLGYPSGNQLFRFAVNGVATPDSINLYSFTKKLEPNQKYSLIITDSIKSTNEMKQMWLKDDFDTPIPSQFGMRFVYAVVNDTAGKTVDVYSVKSKANIFSNVPIGTATGFVYRPTTLSNDTLIVRRPGITTWELARLNGVTYTNQRVYTFIYRGDTKATGTKGKSLTSYLNL